MSLNTAWADGHSASQRLRASHSSDSKWLKAIERIVRGSMTFATSSRTRGKSPRRPV